MLNRFTCFLVVILFLSTGSVLAEFQAWEAGARGPGMGGALVAIEGEDALFLNPSGLPRSGKTSFILTSSDLYGLGMTHSFLGVTTNLKGIGFGVAFSRFDDPELAYQLDNFQASGAVNLSSKVSLGTTLRYGILRSQAGGANSVIGDFGLLWHPVDSLRLGMVAQNLFATVNYEQGLSGPPPTEIKGGVAVNLPGNTVFSFNIPTSNFNLKEWQYGIEKWYSDQFGVRLGLKDGRLTAGMSFAASVWHVDYAYLPHELGQTHRISLRMSLGGVERK